MQERGAPSGVILGGRLGREDLRSLKKHIKRGVGLRAVHPALGHGLEELLPNARDDRAGDGLAVLRD